MTMRELWFQLVTAADLRELSSAKLDTLYGELTATALPQGRFMGRAWSHSLPVWLLAWAWQGKVFEKWISYHVTKQPYVIGVWNRILGRELIEGSVTLEGDEIVIRYPQLRLTDRLKPVTPALWLGQMRLWGHVVWFTLEAET